MFKYLRKGKHAVRGADRAIGSRRAITTETAIALLLMGNQYTR